MSNVDGLSRTALERTPGADERAAPIFEMHGRVLDHSKFTLYFADAEFIAEEHGGEPDIPRHLEEIQEVVDRADLRLIIGLAVIYASGIKYPRGKLTVFNSQEAAKDQYTDFLFVRPCKETLPKALFGEQTD
ncbi:hypothetical protein DAEQUDRAFT_765670 [Daedalea quercina L-15889]|uniref:Uncharacterized protein n=1 Tax=Daedalea quercina L-15889 TaxID=1314783 RepID=A0A165Q7I8_9APHY|nr:hypothetical protein DAEQUDRAFT_765670 [Daedalea quercina L-15889]